MYAANSHVIRLAGDADERALRRLARLDAQPPLEHPILIGEIDGEVAAALALDDRRAIALPSRPTAVLVAQLRIRADAFDAEARTPALRERLRGGVRLRPRAA